MSSERPHALEREWLEEAERAFECVSTAFGTPVRTASPPRLQWSAGKATVAVAWWPYGFETALTLEHQDRRAVVYDDELPRHGAALPGVMSSSRSGHRTVLRAFASAFAPSVQQFLEGDLSEFNELLVRRPQRARVAEAQRRRQAATAAFRARDWALAGRLFTDAADSFPDVPSAPEIAQRAAITARHLQRAKDLP